MNLCHKNSYWAAMYSVIEDEKNLEFNIKDVKRSVYVLVKTFCVPQLHVVQVRYYIIVINKIKVKTQARPRPVTYKATFNLCEM